MPALTDVKTWLYHLGDVSDARAAEISATNADMVVTEWADYSGDERPYTAADLDAMRGTDTDRLIVSYISIGEAENYRYYWDTAWEETPPAWIDAVNPEWIDNIKVKYWDAEWQEIIFDYVERIVDAGFNGVYLDIIEGYEYWEDKGGAVGNARDYRADMAEFVADLRTRAEARIAEVDPDRDFVIIGQNGFELLEEQVYADAIDGAAREDARFYYEYGRPQKFEEQRVKEWEYNLDLMQQADKDGIVTFAVEYIPEAALEGAKATLAAEAKDLGAADIPLFIADNRDLDTIPDQPAEADTGVFPLLTKGAVEPEPEPEPQPEPEPEPDPKDIVGGKKGDDLSGTRKDDKVFGLGGNDELFGKGGKDEIHGGDGNDYIEGGGGKDRLYGEAGQDELFGGGGKDKAFGGDGADYIEGGGGKDVLIGGAASDELFGGGGNDRIIGGAGGELMEGGRGRDSFVFRDGDGFDEIDDFETGKDRLDISGRSYDIRVGNDGLMVDFGGGDEVYLADLGRNDVDDLTFV